jgi:hypothetical protein
MNQGGADTVSRLRGQHAAFLAKLTQGLNNDQLSAILAFVATDAQAMLAVVPMPEDAPKPPPFKP